MSEKPLKKLNLSRQTVRDLKTKTGIKPGVSGSDSLQPTEICPMTSSKHGSCSL
jgi:hypothetical protein